MHDQRHRKTVITYPSSEYHTQRVRERIPLGKNIHVI